MNAERLRNKRKIYLTIFGLKEILIIDIDKAIAFATKSHAGQTRKYTGEAYIEHPLRVAENVIYYTDDDKVIVAAILHDVVEDCDVDYREIEIKFGLRVAAMVWELTNASKGSKLKRSERKAIDRQHIAAASENAQLIKALDRLDNLRDIHKGPKDFQRLYATESLALASVLTKAPKVLVDEIVRLSNDLLT